MLQLLWGTLNIALFLYFLFVCFKAVKLVRYQLGSLAAIVLVIGLLSFIGRSSEDESDNELQAEIPMEFADASTTRLYNVVIEETLTQDYHLYINFSQEESSSGYVTANVSSFVTGFTSGTSWEPHMFIANTEESKRTIEYTIDGTVDWLLLGVKLYSEPKTYTGTIDLKTNR